MPVPTRDAEPGARRDSQARGDLNSDSQDNDDMESCTSKSRRSESVEDVVSEAADWGSDVHVSENEPADPDDVA